MVYLFLFFSAFLSGSFIPLASEPGLVYLVANDHNTVLLLFSASVGNTLGGMTCYLLCRLGYGHYLRFKTEKLEAWRQRLKDKSEPFAMLCWLPIVGELIAGALGFISDKWKQVLIYMFLGKLFRYVVVIYFYEVIGSIN